VTARALATEKEMVVVERPHLLFLVAEVQVEGLFCFHYLQ